MHLCVEFNWNKGITHSETSTCLCTEVVKLESQRLAFEIGQ